MKKLGDHLYVFGDTCQVYIIKNGSYAVLVDFGSGEVLDRLKDIGVVRVTDILITHHHRDQVQGLKRANELGIAVWVPHQEQDLIADADELWQRREIYNNYNNRQDRFSILNSVTIAGTLKDYSVRKFNGIEFTVWPTPGHTVGSISISAVIDEKKIFFTGDLIYEGGKLWSLAATMWSYNGGEGLPYHVLSLSMIKEQGFDCLLPSHGEAITSVNDIDSLLRNLMQLMKTRKQNFRLSYLMENPYEELAEHVLYNRTSTANSYVLVSRSGKALFLDFGYDFMEGTASGSDRSSRRPWLYTIPKLMKEHGVTRIDACIPTHYHDDHVAGINLLKEVYHARLLCPENFADILNQPERYDLPCLWYDPIPVDEVLPLNRTFQWEEYELTLHPLSGHTRYAVAIEFEADGKKFLCTGDQYAGEEGLYCNFVYKNKFRFDDYIKSAQLYQKLRPDFILSGHWSKLSYNEEYAKKIDELGKDIYDLHMALLPDEEYSGKTEDFPAVLYPYQARVKPGEEFSLRIEVINPYAWRNHIKVQLVLPEGFGENIDFEADAEAHETVRFAAQITAGTDIVRRARVGCNVTIGEHNLGEQAEMLVTVDSCQA